MSDLVGNLEDSFSHGAAQCDDVLTLFSKSTMTNFVARTESKSFRTHGSFTPYYDCSRLCFRNNDHIQVELVYSHEN